MIEVTHLNEKVLREKEFHNQWAKSIRLDDLLVREAFESPTAIENQYALSVLGDLKGKKILDLGCGAGEAATYFAFLGAQVHACDISDEFLLVAKSLADKFKVELHLNQADTAKLPYPDDFFDAVFANGVLHHVELLSTVREVRRVLKSGGKAVFIEPLPYNPVINVYRLMAKEVRTEDERPLSFRKIDKMKPLFSKFSHREFWLFSLAIFFHFFFVRRWNPSKVRYWKKVIEEGKSYENMFASLQKLDEQFMKLVPFSNYLCWNTVITVVK